MGELAELTEFEQSLTGPQRDSARSLRKALQGAHHVDVAVRKGGADFVFQADWLREALNRLCSD